MNDAFSAPEPRWWELGLLAVAILGLWPFLRWIGAPNGCNQRQREDSV